MQNVDAKPSSQVKGEHLGLGILLTILGGVGWGFSGACAQYLFNNYGVDPRWIVCMRLTFAGVIFLVVAAIAQRDTLMRVLRSPKALGRMAGYSLCGLALCMFCYLHAIEASNAGTATVLQALNLVIILGVTCLQLRRKPTKKETIGVALALGGTFLMATHGQLGSLALTPAGLAWGLINAVAAALYTLLPGKLLHEFGSVVTTGVAMFSGALVAWPLFQPWTVMPQLDAAGIWAVVGIVLVGTVLAYFMFLTGVRMIGSMLAGLFASTEPITAGVLSVVWLGTTFAPIDLVGMGMIVAMMFLMV